MSDTTIQKTKNKLAKMYGTGILVFTAIVGFISVLVLFIANVDWT